MSSVFSEFIEDYEVLNLLGKGGFAKVYQARCRKNGAMCAIKMIEKHHMIAAGMVHRVRQEVTIHSRLKHPAVLELYGFFEDSNYVYLILELAHNGELYKYLKAASVNISEKDAACIMRQVVSGVMYLHSHNIIHRDLSLSNLLLTKDMQVKIADFGLATQLSIPNETHVTMCGTPNYISPEVASRSSHGLPADVWGLGCMLYTLLVGQPPFDATAVKSTLKRVVIGEYVIPNHLSEDAQDLIRRLLKTNPNERILLQDINRHPFMTKNYEKFYASSDQANILSGDSGILTFSSDGQSKNCSDISYLQSKISISNSKENNFYQSNEDVHAHPLRLEKQLVHMGCDINQLKIHNDHQHLGMCCNGSSYTKQCESQLYSVTSNKMIKDMDYNEVQNSVDRNRNMMNPSPISRDLHDGDFILRTSADTLSIPPINTNRLSATRHKTKNAILNINENGEVVLEFTKSKSNQDKVIEILKISNDGNRISVCLPAKGRLEVQKLPQDTSSRSCWLEYTFENLPRNYWKKYMYAARFVNLVKGKTPKVTYYSTLAKCQLMESLEDFEVNFFSGEKVIKTSKGIKIFDRQGVIIEHKQTSLALDVSKILQHFEETLSHCELIEKTLSSIKALGTCFPVIIGRRPTNKVYGSSKEISNSNTNVTNNILQNLPSVAYSFDGCVLPKNVSTDTKMLFSNTCLQNSAQISSEQVSAFSEKQNDQIYRNKESFTTCTPNLNRFLFKKTNQGPILQHSNNYRSIR